MIDTLEINGQKIVPGQRSTIELDIAKLPSGTPIHLYVHVHRSANPGPTLLVCGGVHGDEVNGVEIVRRTLAEGLFDNLKCGSVIAIPLVNVYGFINFSRDLADGKDVNRSFPGSASGSLASRVAYALTHEIIPSFDYGIDYHTGGASRHNHPQIRHSEGDEKAAELARIFAAPYTIANTPISKSFRKEAYKNDKPILVFEGGESLRYHTASVEVGIAGLKRVMQHLGMIDTAPKPDYSTHIFTDTHWVRSPRSGLFLWHRCSGEYITEGTLLGEINDPQAQEKVPVLANSNGYIVGHNNAPVVSQGDALFHIGMEEVTKK